MYINLAHISVQHDKSKHVKVYRHLIKEKLDSGSTCTPYVSTNGQLAELTKGLANLSFQAITSNLEMYNIYSPSWGGDLRNSWSFEYLKVFVQLYLFLLFMVRYIPWFIGTDRVIKHA